jgi:hypothetical protein
VSIAAGIHQAGINMSGESTSTSPKRITLDKIASGTFLGNIKSKVDLGSEIPARSGTVVAGRILNGKSTYNTLEDTNGRMRLVQQGDLIAGVLGYRNALHGYVGRVPERVRVGDVLNVLNLGGVVGEVTSYNPDVGLPFQLEILGCVMHYPAFGERRASPLVIERSPELLDGTLPENLPPIVAVAGTSMNAGKTTAICELLRRLRRSDKKVAAAKCTGVSLLRDVLEMRDFGASSIMSFMDLGVVSTQAPDGPPLTKAIIRTLAKQQPDMILLEFGDGILGTYGVPEILGDAAIRKALTAVALCAGDPVGAWGGMHLMRDRFGIDPCVITGPVTDNRGGTAAAEREFGVASFNARREGDDLLKAVMNAVAKKA